MVYIITMYLALKTMSFILTLLEGFFLLIAAASKIIAGELANLERSLRRL